MRACKAIRLTQDGIYKDEFRSIIRKLAGLGVAVSQCGTVLGIFIQAYCEILGIDIGGPKAKIRIPSIRTVGRIIDEACIASNLQNAAELLRCKGKLNHYIPTACVYVAPGYSEICAPAGTFTLY